MSGRRTGPTSTTRTGIDATSGRAVGLKRSDVAVRRVDAPTDAPDADLLVSPGWTDVQVNGFAGHDVNGAPLPTAGFEAMARALAAAGVTRFLPTVITAAVPALEASLRAAAHARRASPLVAGMVPGIHLEGPFISPEDGARGAHPLAAVRDPDIALFDALQEAAGGGIRLVTLAPERPGAMDLIAHLRAQGIIIAIGHSLADVTAIAEAVAAGATLSTHLGNGAPARLPRHPNVIWEQLAEDRLFASAIFDGHHLPDSVMRVLLRVKAPERLLLTSDAVSLAGCAPGVYDGQVGGKVELHASGRLTVHGSEYLAGSASSLLDGVNSALRLGVPLADAVAMVTRVPERLLGLEARGDLTVLRRDGERLRVVLTVADGEIVYEDTRNDRAVDPASHATSPVTGPEVHDSLPDERSGR